MRDDRCGQAAGSSTQPQVQQRCRRDAEQHAGAGAVNATKAAVSRSPPDPMRAPKVASAAGWPGLPATAVQRASRVPRRSRRPAQRSRRSSTHKRVESAARPHLQVECDVASVTRAAAEDCPAARHQAIRPGSQRTERRNGGIASHTARAAKAGPAGRQCGSSSQRATASATTLSSSSAQQPIAAERPASAASGTSKAPIASASSHPAIASVNGRSRHRRQHPLHVARNQVHFEIHRVSRRKPSQRSHRGVCGIRFSENRSRRPCPQPR